jgi:hypothetical protein
MYLVGICIGISARFNICWSVRRNNTLLYKSQQDAHVSCWDLYSRMSARISLVSVTGIFGYKIVMSSVANVKWDSIGVSFSFCIRCLEFSMLNVYGRGAS